MYCHCFQSLFFFFFSFSQIKNLFGRSSAKEFHVGSSYSCLSIFQPVGSNYVPQNNVICVKALDQTDGLSDLLMFG